jgi:hypothetical protein
MLASGGRLDEPVRSAVAAFAQLRYEESVVALAAGARAGNAAAQLALGCVMEGMERAHFRAALLALAAPELARHVA